MNIPKKTKSTRRVQKTSKPYKKRNGLVVINDNMCWFIDGLLHREDGPAIVGISSNTKEWFLLGIEYTEEEFEVQLKLKAFW